MPSGEPRLDGRNGFLAPEIRIISSSERHGSFERAVRLLGLGSSHIKLLEVDGEGRLIPAALETELRKAPDAPTLVLLQAGDINIGAYDPFESLIPIAKRYRSWVHSMRRWFRGGSERDFDTAERS